MLLNNHLSLTSLAPATHTPGEQLSSPQKSHPRHTHTAETRFMESLSFPPATCSGIFCCVSQSMRVDFMTPPGGGTLENSVPGRCSPAGEQGRDPCLERYEQKHILQEGPPGFSSREVGRCIWHSAPRPQMSQSSGSDLPSCKRGGQGSAAHPHHPLQSSLPWQPEGFLKNSFRFTEKCDNSRVFIYATPHVPLVNADKVRLSQLMN